jgi:hypothetical protein
MTSAFRCRIVGCVRIALLALLLLAGCATIGSQVKDACPESAGVVCNKGDHRCTDDPVRGCKVCACGAVKPDAGGLLKERPLSSPPSKVQ